jgi:hypothetical protein
VCEDIKWIQLAQDMMQCAGICERKDASFRPLKSGKFLDQISQPRLYSIELVKKKAS